MSDFSAYCRTLTNAQLLAVLEREDEGRTRDADRESDYQDAREECIRRGLEPDLGARR